MSGRSKIEWTERVWNPVRGCSLVSPGCTNCYAMRQAHRFSGKGQPYEGLTRMAEHGPVWTGDIRLVSDVLDEPLRWRTPSRVFVNSMSDLFHEGIADEFIEKIFTVMALATRHTFQVLTKRPARMSEFVEAFFAGDWLNMHAAEFMDELPPRNVWLGVSVENQAAADERIPLLLQTPAAVRFLSVEPLLEPVDIRRWVVGCNDYREPPEHRGIHWVIVGGESGTHARPCNVEWIRDVVHQCKAAQVACFVKQLGTKPEPPTPMRLPSWSGTTGRLFRGWLDDKGHALSDPKGSDPAEWPEDLRIREYPAEVRA